MNSTNGTSNLNNTQFEIYDLILITIAVLTILFNGGVLLMMWKNKSLHNAQNCLLASLAVSDMSSGLIGIPLVFVCTFVPPDYCGLCSVGYYFFKFISISTVLHILAIIGERCFLVVDPFLHRRLRAVPGRSNVIIICSIWLTSLLASSVPWIWVAGMIGDCQKPEHGHEDIWTPDTMYEITCFVLFFVIPLVLITFFLAKIFIAVHQFTRRKSKRCSETLGEEVRVVKSEMRIFLVLLCMLLLFVACWCPYFASTLLHFINEELPDWLYAATPYLRGITSLLNPLVYAFYKDDFYQAIKRKLHSMKFWSEARESDVFTSRQRAQVPLVPLS